MSTVPERAKLLCEGSIRTSSIVAHTMTESHSNSSTSVRRRNSVATGDHVHHAHGSPRGGHQRIVFHYFSSSNIYITIQCLKKPDTLRPPRYLPSPTNRSSLADISLNCDSIRSCFDSTLETCLTSVARYSRARSAVCLFSAVFASNALCIV